MTLYRFKAPGKVALSNDKSGRNLPAGIAWQADGEVKIGPGDGPRVGASSTDILRGVETDGYFIWPGQST